MRPFVFAVLVSGLFGVVPAHATVAVAIDLTHQKMHVTSSSGTYDWSISSARSGFSTPGGSYAPTRLEAMHYSHKYHMSPMPHSIFFRGGYAIHGTYATGSLGRPASHGCIRLSPDNASRLYTMVKAEGALISISGSPPRTVYAARQPTYADQTVSTDPQYGSAAAETTPSYRYADSTGRRLKGARGRNAAAPAAQAQDDPFGLSSLFR